MNQVILVLLSALLSRCQGGGSEVIVPSPNHRVLFRVLTRQVDAHADSESIVEVRDDRDSLLASRNFQSQDGHHGQRVVSVSWTEDSSSCVFSTVFSGGKHPGQFPTYIYDRPGGGFHSADSLIHVWITDPYFYLDPPDILLVTGRDWLDGCELGDTLQRAAHIQVLLGQ